MKASFFKGVVLGAVVGGVTAISSIAFAGSGVGGVFNLGKTNGVNASTVLTGSTNGRQLSVRNNSTGSAAAGLEIHTANNSKPPLVVNSSKQVTNLNASLLGGLPQSGFVHGKGSVIPSGYVTVPKPGSSDLGTIPGIGTLHFDCGTNGAGNARLMLFTLNTLGNFFYADIFGNAIQGTGSQPMVLLPDGLPAIAFAQISTGTMTATITAAQADLADHCLVQSQVVVTQK
jgi:hypothetical protein